MALFRIISVAVQEMIEVYYQLVDLDGVKITPGVDIVEVKDAANIIHLRYICCNPLLFTSVNV